MNIVFWVDQGLVAIAFLYAGGIKVFVYDYYLASLKKYGQTPVSRGLATTIGVFELVGAVGVVLPMALHITPVLSAWAAIGLAVIMLLALGYHLRGREPAAAPLILFCLSAFVGVGRMLNY